MASETRRSFKPALTFHRLTPLFDAVVVVASRERAFKARLLEHAALQDGESVLDLGCGTGTLALAALDAVPGAELVGLDADPQILRRARAKAGAAGARIAFDEGFSTDLPYEDDRFDAVLSTLFFHHLEDDDKSRTAKEVHRVLKPGGRLIVGDMGKPQDPLMRMTVAATVQAFDGRTTTSSNVAGRLPAILRNGGLIDVDVTHRMRTPTGTIEIVTGRKWAPGPRQGTKGST